LVEYVDRVVNDAVAFEISHFQVPLGVHLGPLGFLDLVTQL
jgi:hypothetical protein